MIYFDDEHIKVGGVILPGIIKSIEVKHSAKVEEIEVEGSDTKPKQATGYEDAKVNIEIILEDSENKTKEDKLTAIQNLFKKQNQDLPEVHEIVSTLTSLRNVTNVIFKDLSSKEVNNKSYLTASLEFWEYVPVSITASKKSNKSSSKSSKSGSSSGSSDSNLTEEYKGYLKDDRGKAPKIKSKESQSPAKERKA